MFSETRTCRSEILIAYGALYDHSSKRPRITQFFGSPDPKAAGQNPAGGDGKPAPRPPAVPKPPAPGADGGPQPPVPGPVPDPSTPAPNVPKLGVPKPPSAPPSQPQPPVPKPPVPKPPAPKPNLPEMQMVCELSDPPVKLMIGPDGLSLVSMATENRKLKKNAILMSNVTGKLVRSTGNAVPPNSIRYAVQANTLCVEHITNEVMIVKELAKKLQVSEIHGYKPFPTGMPQKLVETSDLRFLYFYSVFVSLNFKRGQRFGLLIIQISVNLVLCRFLRNSISRGSPTWSPKWLLLWLRSRAWFGLGVSWKQQTKCVQQARDCCKFFCPPHGNAHTHLWKHKLLTCLVLTNHIISRAFEQRAPDRVGCLRNHAVKPHFFGEVLFCCPWSNWTWQPTKPTSCQCKLMRWPESFGTF